MSITLAKFRDLILRRRGPRRYRCEFRTGRQWGHRSYWEGVQLDEPDLHVFRSGECVLGVSKAMVTRRRGRMHATCVLAGQHFGEAVILVKVNSTLRGSLSCFILVEPRCRR